MDHIDSYMQEYQNWLNSPYVDEATKAELRAITDEKEIKERFYKDLEFGTGGLRGIMGAGSNRMNVYTVRKATQGLANYILKQGPEAAEMGVVIAHDCRNMSPEFCREAAMVLNGNGIRAYVFDGLRPTPMLSYAVRRMGATAGIVVTASHNPKEYNGYKVYWADGGQTPYPRDEEIIGEVNQVTDFSLVKRAEREIDGLFVRLGADVDGDYINEVKKQSVNGDIIPESLIRIVYTPLHGTGYVPVRSVLKQMGYRDLLFVEEQIVADGSFPTVPQPNPEDPAAFAMAVKLAKDSGADLIIATDPDADRLGVVARDKTGEYVYFTGNQIGVILEEYILSQKKHKGKLPAKPAVVSTIVSTNLAEVIAKSYGAEYYNVLTGFKYIGEKIKEFETREGGPSFMLGFEESIGYLAGTHSRDKDAVVAAMLVCEAAAYHLSCGLTLPDALDDIYKKYGYYKEVNESVTMPGLEGLSKIRAIMANLRENPVGEVAGRKVTEARDYLSGVITSLFSGEQQPTGLPVSDVLYYTLDDESWFCVRPSGTEPKIKIYYGVKADGAEAAGKAMDEIKAAVKEIVR